MFLVYVIGTVIITVYILNNILSKDVPLVKLGMFKYAISFLVALFVSTLLSTNIQTSMWGYYSRFTGLFAITTFVALGFIACASFKKEDFMKLLVFGIFSGVLVSLYGIIQSFTNASIARVYSTIGQPNWLSQYIGMLLPLLIIGYSRTPFVSKKYSDWVLLVAYALMFWCLWLTFSMSGLFGVVLSLLFLPKLNTKKLSIIAGISLAIILINFSKVSFLKSRIMDVMQEVKTSILEMPVVYAAGEEYSVSDSGFIRKYLWQGTLAMSLENPRYFVFGRGLQTFPYEFQKYRPSALNYSSEWDYLINRPHNYYLELLVETGIFGLFAYLYLLKTMFDNAPKYLKSSLIVFYVTNIFGWPIVTTSLLFWMLFGYISLNNFSKSS